ncbi:hypothetical protein CR513_52168, partial [Mucuna pruriens]
MFRIGSTVSCRERRASYKTQFSDSRKTKSKKASLQHPYKTRSKTKPMEVIMDDLKEQHEVLKNDVNQLKKQMSQIQERLQSMQHPSGNIPKQPQVILNHPLGFTPNQHYNQTQYPCMAFLLAIHHP